MAREINMYDPEHYTNSGYLVANSFTLLRPIFALSALVAAGNGDLATSALSLGAMLLTELDGRVARYTQSETIHGAFRDNLADLSMRTVLDLIGPVAALSFMESQPLIIKFTLLTISVGKLLKNASLSIADINWLTEFYQHDISHVNRLIAIVNSQKNKGVY